jgi:hypothetical protein
MFRAPANPTPSKYYFDPTPMISRGFWRIFRIIRLFALGYCKRVVE